MLPSELHAGDVMLLQDTSESAHYAIAMGQRMLSALTPGAADITHAGIYGDGGVILEASGSGHGLQPGLLWDKKETYHFEIYRYHQREVAAKAAEWAWNMVLERNAGSGYYSKFRALKSLFHRSTLSSLGRAKIQSMKAHALADDLSWMIGDRGFYCSGFVVKCFIMATAHEVGNPINLDYRYVTPKRLHGELIRNPHQWSRVGFITAGSFRGMHSSMTPAHAVSAAAGGAV